MNILHSSRSDAWGTPADIVARVKGVLGRIDLDPASEAYFNETVGAERIITRNSLCTPWLRKPGTIYLNPPGGKTGNESNTKLFWNRLMYEVAQGRVSDAIFMAFSVEALAVTQNRTLRPITDHLCCVPKKRIQFVSKGVEKRAPSHSNVIVYVPGVLDRSERFISVFRDLGALTSPCVL